MPLFAVHISADVLSAPCMLLGFILLGGFLVIGLFRLQEDEVARVGLMSAAFFVASAIHVSLGPTSVHLLLNGLVGIILGRRAGVAIPVGVTLQAALLGHGSLATIGVNSSVMLVPALLARPLFRGLVGGWRPRLGDGLLAIGCVLDPWS